MTLAVSSSFSFVIPRACNSQPPPPVGKITSTAIVFRPCIEMFDNSLILLPTAFTLNDNAPKKTRS